MSTQESPSEQGAPAPASPEHGTSEERPGPTNVGEMKPPSHPLGRRAADRWGPDDLTHESVEKLRLEIKSLRRAGITTAASVVGALTALFGAYLQSSVSKAERTLAQLEVAQAKYSVDSLKREQTRFAGVRAAHVAEIDRVAAELARLKQERDAVAASLDNAQAQLTRVGTVVGSLPDNAQRRELLQGVARVRTSVENAAGVTDVQRTQEDSVARAFLAQTAPPAGGPAPSPATLATVRVDVFYLRDAPGERERAARVRDRLVASGALRDVRLKSAGAGYLRALGVDASQIRHDADERAVADALLRLLDDGPDAAGTTLRPIPSRTRNYLSLFLVPPAAAGGGG